MARQSTGDDLRIGVVGMGRGTGLGRLLHRPGAGSRVAMACDVRPGVDVESRAIFGADLEFTEDYRRMLDAGLDAVVVTTPDHFHEEMAVALLSAGVPVFLDKPMATTIEGCDNILRAAYESKTRLYVGHNMRHFAMIRKMRALIDRGDIGEVKAVWCRHFVGHGGDFYFKNWNADRRNSTGLLLQKGVHDIDVIHWLSGGYTRRVVGMGGLTLYGDITDRRDNSDRAKTDWWVKGSWVWPPLALRELNPVVDVEDLSMITMQLDNGAYATYQQCHYTPDYWRNYTVIGTEGRMENFGDETGLIRVWNQRVNFDPEGDVVHRVESSTPHGGGDIRLIDEFLEYLRGDGPVTTSPVAAREAVATGVSATESIRDRSEPRDVPGLPQDMIDYFETEAGAGPRS